MGNLKVFTKRTRGEQDIQNALLRLASFSDPSLRREIQEYPPVRSGASRGLYRCRQQP